MIEVSYKNNDVRKFDNIDKIQLDWGQFLSLQFLDFAPNELLGVSKKFSLDLTAFNQNDDIEISSHYHEKTDQLTFNFSIPCYSTEKTLEEEQIFFIIKNDVFFTFLTSKIEKSISQVSKNKYDNASNLTFTSHKDLFLFFISSISDYFADITELTSKKIKILSERILKNRRFIESDLDLITELNFSNILIKESLTEFQRILILLKKNKTIEVEVYKQIRLELTDIVVVTEHLQYNFDRLDDLKENLASKIDLEQNKIFKTLTIITICIALPTLVAGIYGMNFSNMPELNWKLGYPLAIATMFLSFILPLTYFKIKKWF